MLRRLKYFILAFGLMLVITAQAAADVPVHNSVDFVVPKAQLWTLVIGTFVPLVTYVINAKFFAKVGEPVKAAIMVGATALATALYTALATDVIGFNSATLQLILSGIAAALAAHGLLWKPSGISVILGAAGTTTPAPVSASPRAPVVK